MVVLLISDGPLALRVTSPVAKILPSRRVMILLIT